MLRSSPYCVLSLSARKVLDRIEIEFADHGGTDNGKLPVTYDDFERYGIHRQAIYPAIRETVALGFVEITEEGVAGGAEFRKPTLYRLTYRHSDKAAGDGTHEWMNIKTDAEAKAIAASARVEKPAQKQFLRYGSRQKSVRKPYRKAGSSSTESTTTVHSTETTTTIDISSVAPEQTPREARPPHGAVASGAAATSIELLERERGLRATVAGRLGRYGQAILDELG
jgi:hypothetical protein